MFPNECPYPGLIGLTIEIDSFDILAESVVPLAFGDGNALMCFDQRRLIAKLVEKHKSGPHDVLRRR